MGGIERQSHRIVQRGFGHVEIRCSLDPLFGDRRQMHPDGEHIDIGRHAGCLDRLGLRQVGLGALDGLLRRLQALGRQRLPVIRAHHPGYHLHLGAALFLSAHLPREIGRLQCTARHPGVVQGLVHRELRLEVVHGIRPVQRPDVEILRPELVLGQQRAEHKNRVVAAHIRLGIVQLGQFAGAGLVDACLRGA